MPIRMLGHAILQATMINRTYKPTMGFYIRIPDPGTEMCLYCHIPQILDTRILLYLSSTVITVQ